MISTLGASVAGGLILALSFPPHSLDIVAWFALIPLLWALAQHGTPGARALCGFAFGASFFAFDVSWVYRTVIVHGHFSEALAAAVFLGMVFALAFLTAVFSVTMGTLSGRGVHEVFAAPFVWVGVEYVRTVLFTGFPWDLVGYSQVNRPALIQIVDVTGVYGISFVVVLVNAAVWSSLNFWIRHRSISWTAPAFAGLVLAATFLYGHIRLNDIPPRPPSFADEGCAVGVLQGNIPQETKWEQAIREQTFATYAKLSKAAVAEGARLLVWPETAVTAVFGTDDPDVKRAGEISSAAGVPMIVGAPFVKAFPSGPRFYNSAFLVDGAMLRFRYDKMHLVPFGEYMPLNWLLPLGPGIAAREEDYSPGEVMTVMRSGDCPPFSVLICYEAIFAYLGRLAVMSGAQLLVNITNDGWFGDTAAPYQHLAMAGMRAVENRVWLVRCANTGISGVFDPAGRMVARIPLETEGLFTVRIPQGTPTGSFYTRFGDIFSWGCILIVGVAILCTGPPRRAKTGM